MAGQRRTLRRIVDGEDIDTQQYGSEARDAALLYERGLVYPRPTFGGSVWAATTAGLAFARENGIEVDDG